MHPVLLKFWDFTFYSYGLMVALGFFFGAIYLSISAKKIKPPIISQDDIFNIIFGVLISAIVGARLLFVIAEFPDMFSRPLEIFKVWEGGLVYYGGFIGSIIFAFAYLKIKKLNIYKVLDLFAPAVALGHFFGRIGCLLAGCCYGKPTNQPWGIVFEDPQSLAVLGVHLHPTQIYEAGVNLILFVILYFYNKKAHKPGMAIAIYLIFYPICRFIIEFFRGDFRGGYSFGLSVSQIISIIVFIIGITIFYRASKCKK
ncbi:MAG: prolipoprotein diacylglyceryl transferase [Elusimicrobiota bacterium]|jgi:phosphatidylglycerol:prolipoprotein diacylglycerol transferase|nr:prolipoprotein diacylglyceryl transferase [Elusimicrobiota bacterium]